jgi:hypothetical protein
MGRQHVRKGMLPMPLSDYRVRSQQDGSLFTVKICHYLFLNGTGDTAEYDFGGPGT